MTTLPTLAPVDSKETEVQCRQIMDQHGLQEWKFQWKRGILHLGLCDYKTKTISLARLQPDGDWRNTILHEIAHALTPRAKHGAAWRAMCLSVGAEPVRSVKSILPAQYWKWIQVCSGCSNEVGKSLRKRRTLYRYRSKCCAAFITQEKLVTKETTNGRANQSLQ